MKITMTLLVLAATTLCTVALFAAPATMTASPSNRTVDTVTGAFQETGTVSTREIVLTSARHAKHAVASSKTLQCGRWEDSAIGGSYKRCEWR